jgi:hypothetical protein
MSSDKEDKKEKPPAYLKEDPAEVVTRAFAGNGKRAFLALLEAGIKEDTLRSECERAVRIASSCSRATQTSARCTLTAGVCRRTP